VEPLAFAADNRPDWVVPKTSEFRHRIDFWKSIYSAIPSSRGILHDPDDLSVIYEKIDISGLTQKQTQRLVKEKKEYYRNILTRFARQGRDALSDEEFKIVQPFAQKSEDEIRRMSSDIRWQQGLSDRFLEGLKRSYVYLDKIREIFTEEGVPLTLAFLPHVESSFNYRAYSKVGAAGIWQFMRDTARIFGLKVNYVLDERLDPVRTARAAARLLKRDYEITGAWPLAITSYNHGVNGIKRAVNELGSTDIEYIVRNFNGRRFGFASQNFFACFVAAYELANNPEPVFGNFEKGAPIQYFEIELPKLFRLSTILEMTGLDEDNFHYYNRAFRPVSYKYNSSIPSGYKLKLPVELSKSRDELIAKFKGSQETITVVDTDIHVVQPGDSLSTISKFYRVPMDRIIEANGLANPSSIRLGQKLVLPIEGKKIAVNGKKTVVASNNQPRGKKDSTTLVIADNSLKENSKLIKGQGRLISPMSASQGIMLATLVPTNYMTKQLSKEDVNSAIESGLEKIQDGSIAQDQNVAWANLPIFFDFDQIMKESLEHPYLVMVAKDEIDVLPDDITKTYNLDTQKINSKTFQITIETNETLGHYADWAGIPIAKIRALNPRHLARNVPFGYKLKIPLSEDRVGSFNANRLQYHQSIEEDFYSNYKVVGTQSMKVGRGDSIESISKEQEVPIWLIRKYLPDHNQLSLNVGQEINLPIIESIQ